jgi:SRSO17 transposase
MTIGALDETGQEKQGSATAGVKRQYMGCAGRRERHQNGAPVLCAGENGPRTGRCTAVDSG